MNFKNVNSFWIRNGYFSYNYLFKSKDLNLGEKVNQFLNTEWKFLTDFFISQLSYKKKRIGNHKELVPNKLTQLYLAQKVGLKIPDTNIVSSYKPNLNSTQDIITKPLST